MFYLDQPKAPNNEKPTIENEENFKGFNLVKDMLKENTIILILTTN